MWVEHHQRTTLCFGTLLFLGESCSKSNSSLPSLLFHRRLSCPRTHPPCWSVLTFLITALIVALNWLENIHVEGDVGSTFGAGVGGLNTRMQKVKLSCPNKSQRPVLTWSSLVVFKAHSKFRRQRQRGSIELKCILVLKDKWLMFKGIFWHEIGKIIHKYVFGLTTSAKTNNYCVFIH